jgi:hypothetical protein
MNKKLTMTVPVVAGKCQWTPAQLERIKTYLSNLADGKTIEISWQPPKSTRSLKQNAYYWLVLSIIAQETGNTTDDLHVVYKDLFLTPKFITLGNKEIEVRKTTTDLTPAEFGEYTEKVCAHAATELQLRIPLPGE